MFSEVYTYAILLALRPITSEEQKIRTSLAIALKIVYDCSCGVSLEPLLDEIFHSFAEDFEHKFPDINVYDLVCRKELRELLQYQWRLYKGIHLCEIQMSWTCLCATG